MRNIKFRSWVIDKNKMLYDFDMLDNNSTSETENHVLMLCTNLTDATGKLIYEGDILRDIDLSNDVLFLCEWQERKKWIGFNIGNWDNDSYEIVGNKYENPELLCRCM
jgi:hypothetical protein